MELAIRDAVTTLWQRMGELYGAAFVNQFGAVGQAAFQTWCLGLRDVTPKQIKLGFTKLLQSEKQMPANYFQFRRLCLPQLEDFGLPKASLAYREACLKAHDVNPRESKWTHSAVYQAASSTGFFELKSMSEREVFPLFERNYDLACQQVMAGEALRDVPKAITDETPKTIAEKNKAHHDALHQKHLQETGFDQLNNPRDAMSAIYKMLGRKE